MLVRRPTDPSKFNGTVVVEWLNVSVAFDSDPDFGFAHQALMRDGFAYVGVSVQPNGILGGGPKIDIPGIDLPPLKEWDPERYGTLAHPGDDYTYDMFSQAGQAVRRPSGVDPLDGLDVQRVIAAGESQSAGRMTTYVNAIQPVTDMFDGFLIHSRGGTGAALTAAGRRMPQNSHIRSDITEPVMQIETETDLIGLGFYGARQPDTDLLRTWELAGTAHADQSTVDYGVESGRQWDTTTQIDFTDLVRSAEHRPAALPREPGHRCVEHLDRRRHATPECSGDRSRQRGDRAGRQRQRGGRHPHAGGRRADLDADGRARRRRERHLLVVRRHDTLRSPPTCSRSTRRIRTTSTR